MIVETATTYFVYRVGPHTLVDPSHVAAIEPVPERPGVRPDKAYLTLTACHPKYAAQQRWIVHGELERAIPRGQGLPAAYVELSGGR
nr:sortase [Arsenicicoccus sp. oral taxon 190]